MNTKYCSIQNSQTINGIMNINGNVNCQANINIKNFIVNNTIDSLSKTSMTCNGIVNNGSYKLPTTYTSSTLGMRGNLYNGTIVANTAYANYPFGLHSLANITLTPGVYILQGFANFYQNTSNTPYQSIFIATISDTSSTFNNNCQETTAYSENLTNISVFLKVMDVVCVTTASKTYYLNGYAYQPTSTSSHLSANTSFKAIRIA